jgi:predicted GTPase
MRSIKTPAMASCFKKFARLKMAYARAPSDRTLNFILCTNASRKASGSFITYLQNAALFGSEGEQLHPV